MREPDQTARSKSLLRPRNQDNPDHRETDADDEQEPRIGGRPGGRDEECRRGRHETSDDEEPGDGTHAVHSPVHVGESLVGLTLIAGIIRPMADSTCPLIHARA